ncbi:MAG: 2-C-methyl-D-erythritol 2,4-cyclodiphosphate synthase [Acidimicrobiia bacterium]|nr:2-C-methyl-D-erythritol 2,4-cyclodiphosphate synthase [Acidimicrobiia bacterium]
MAETRVGIGYDVHRFDSNPPVLVGGIIVDTDRGVDATSDGDVACHALSDALLGAANLGDMGMHFPSSDERWHGADSIEMLTECVRMVSAKSVRVVAADLTVISQSVRIGPHRDAIRQSLAAALAIDPDRVSVKATTTDGVGALGRDEAIAAMAVVTASVD